MTTAYNLGWQFADVKAVARSTIGVVPSDWNGLFRSYTKTLDRRETADVTLELEPIPGWFNTRKVEPGSPVWAAFETPEGIQLEGPDFTGLLRSTDLAYEGKFKVDCDGVYGIVGLLRSVLAQIVADRGMLFLHASGVVRNGRLWLFSGPANSGKTTIAEELTGGGEPFCVDRAILSCRGAQVIAHPTPISDWTDFAPRLPAMQPAAIAIIEQAPTTSLALLSPAQTACRLLQQTMHPRGQSQVLPRLVETSGRIAELIPAFEMRFTREESFWSLLDERTGAKDIAKQGGIEDARSR